MKIYFVKSIEPYVRNCPNITEVGAGMRYRLSDSRIAEQAFTTSANTCSGFVLNAGKKNLVGHIQPEGFNTRNFALAFEKLVNDFQAMYGKIRSAFVFGGRESSYVDPNCKVRSNEVSGTICNILSTKCGVTDENFVSIIGKRSQIKSFDDVAVIGDKIYFANREFENVGLDKAPSEEVEELAEKIYEDVFIPEKFL